MNNLKTIGKLILDKAVLIITLPTCVMLLMDYLHCYLIWLYCSFPENQEPMLEIITGHSMSRAKFHVCNGMVFTPLWMRRLVYYSLSWAFRYSDSIKLLPNAQVMSHGLGESLVKGYTVHLAAEYLVLLLLLLLIGWYSWVKF